ADDRNLFRVDVMEPKAERSPLGDMRLGKVQRRDVARVVDRCIARGAPVTATRLLARLRAAFNWAVSRGYVTANPCLGIKPPVSYRERARERVLDTQEIRAFYAVLPTCGLHLSHQRILRLQLLLGQRLGEVCGMTKRELNAAECLWTIPANRAKNGREHIVPLPPEAREIISEAIHDADQSARDNPALASVFKTEFVFPSKDLRKPITANIVSHALERVQHLPPEHDGPLSKHRPKSLPPRVAFGFMHPQTGEPNPFTSHDLRRTLATQTEKLGVTLRVISKLLNHTEAKSVTDAIYARAELMAERFEALVRWERALKDIRDGKDPLASSPNTFRDIEARILGNQPIRIEAATR
ncbi:MAG: tyrosine-type recombinase/integrase, partial [Hyphomicrobium sp.]